MPHRPLVFVVGLTFGDYLLWNWSLNGNHDVLALVSGLTIPPLAVVCVWLLALSLARVMGQLTRRRPARGASTARATSRRNAAQRTTADARGEHGGRVAADGAAHRAAPASAGAPSGKLAA